MTKFILHKSKCNIYAFRWNDVPTNVWFWLWPLLCSVGYPSLSAMSCAILVSKIYSPVTINTGWNEKNGRFVENNHAILTKLLLQVYLWIIWWFYLQYNLVPIFSTVHLSYQDILLKPCYNISQVLPTTQTSAFCPTPSPTWSTWFCTW